MKKIYSYIDKHNGEIIASSKTRIVLEEMMCDDFMETYRNEMQDAVDSAWIAPLNPSEDCKQYAKDTWDMIMHWYKEVYDIQRSNLI